MIAYHFTTWETWKSTIEPEGLMPAPVAERHFPDLSLVEPYVREGAIWLYRNPLAGHKLLGQLFYVAVNHHSDRIVRLAAEYDDWQAASWLALREMQENPSHTPSDTVNLTHTLDAGHFGHDREHIELVISPIPPERIRLDGQWNLVSLIVATSSLRASSPAGSRIDETSRLSRAAGYRVEVGHGRQLVVKLLRGSGGRVKYRVFASL
jgi:hypothetical protein